MRQSKVERSHLQKGVTSNDAKEPFEPFPPGFDDLIGEPVSEDFAGERGNVDASRLPFEDITERFKVRVTTSHKGVA